MKTNFLKFKIKMVSLQMLDKSSVFAIQFLSFENVRSLRCQEIKQKTAGMRTCLLDT